MNSVALVLASPSSSTSSIINIQQRCNYKHQHRLPQSFIITWKSTSRRRRRRRLSIAQAMEQSSGSGSLGGVNEAAKGANSDADQNQKTAAPGDGSGDGEATKDTSSDANPDQASGSPSITLSNIPTWAKVAIGAILLFAIPFYKKLSSVQSAIEKGAYTAVEFVEKTAEVVEKVSDVVGGNLPPGELRETVEKIHEVAIIVDKSSEGLKVVIEKIDTIPDEIDAVAQSLIHKGEKIQQTIQVDEEISMITKKK